MIFIGNLFSRNSHAFNQRRIRPSSPPPAASFSFFFFIGRLSCRRECHHKPLHLSCALIFLSIYKFTWIVAAVVTGEPPNDFLIRLFTWQAELTQSLQQLSEKAKSATEVIQRLKSSTEQVHVSTQIGVHFLLDGHRATAKENKSTAAKVRFPFQLKFYEPSSAIRSIPDGHTI